MGDAAKQKQKDVAGKRGQEQNFRFVLVCFFGNEECQGGSLQGDGRRRGQQRGCNACDGDAIVGELCYTDLKLEGDSIGAARGS